MARKRFNTQRELVCREAVVKMCWSYLKDNFHKFKQSEKIRILTAICTKSIPQEIEGIKQQIIVSATIQKQLPGEPENTNRLQDAEYLIGSPPTTT